MIHMGDHLAEVAGQATHGREVSAFGLLDTAGCHAQLQFSFHSPAESQGGDTPQNGLTQNTPHYCRERYVDDYRHTSLSDS